jgi:site-specific recombinase XerD
MPSSTGHHPTLHDEEPLNLPVHGPPRPDPLIRSFERHLYAENRSARTVTTYLIAVRQADTFLRGRGISLEAATQADLEAFMGDLLARRTASAAATYHKVLKILYGWLAEEEAISTTRSCPPTRHPQG